MQAHENLRPSQRHFRRLLRSVAGWLSPEASIVDIASNDAEFRHLFGQRRYVAIDASARELQRAVELGRCELAVVGDIRMPPLQEESWDLVLTTNTLLHISQSEATAAVLALRGAVRPGGFLVMTLPFSWFKPIRDQVLSQDRIVEVRSIRNGIVRFADRLFVFGRRRVRGTLRGSRWRALSGRLAMIAALVLGEIGNLPLVKELLWPDDRWIVVVPGKRVSR